MVYENFSAYTEVDPNTRLTKTVTRCTCAALTYLEDAYIYKDKGLDHFTGNFEHLIDVRTTSSSNISRVQIWALWNSIGSVTENAADDGIFVFFYYDNGLLSRIYMRERHNGSDYSDSTASNLTVNQTYYLTIARVSNVLTCKIYDHPDRGVGDLVDTLTLTLHSTIDYQYIYGMQSAGVAGLGVMSAYCENLDLQEAVPIIGGSVSSGVIPAIMMRLDLI